MSNMYDKFTNLYSVSKTLRFELKPQGKTLENLKINNVIQDDEHRAESYKRAKKMIDEYHKKFINEVLENYKIDLKLLKEYIRLKKENNKNEKQFNDIKNSLRKTISDAFTKNVEYKKIFGKEMIIEILPTFYSDNDQLSILDEFSKFTTYFNGFNENRKNMYVADEKSTSIAYRIINENLPMFISNMDIFEQVEKALSKDTIQEIYNDLQELMQVNNLKEMFEIEYFNDVLSQRGIDIYNQIIGGYSKVDGTKIKGINEYINEYNQNNPKSTKIAKLRPLYKQILSEGETASFVIEKVENDQCLLNMINELAVTINNKVLNIKDNLENLLKKLENYNLEKIYIRNDLSITEISQYLYGDWSVISQCIKDDYDKKFGIPNSEKKEENKKKYLKSRKYLSIKYLNDCSNEKQDYKSIQKYFMECSQKDEVESKKNIFRNIEEKYNEVAILIKNEYPTNKNLKEDAENIAKIKDYLDSLKQLQLFIKPLVGVRFEADLEKDNLFYEQILCFWDEMQEITSVYNKTRNYLTGKPYSTEKIKLNFNNQELLNGWDVNKEPNNKSVILRKNGLYYLAIINKDYKYTLDRNEKINQDDYEKMEYKLLPGPNKMLPKVFFSEKNSDIYKPSYELLHKYKNGQHKKGENFDINFCHELIDYFKYCISIHPDWNNFNFKFSETKSYNDISEFYKEVEHQGYKISYTGVNSEYLDDLVEEGKVYLFQIYNKDFSEYSHGKSNLHTLYWKAIFDEENLKDVVYKLNGEAEIFYRKASIKRDITHPKNQKINNKNCENPKKQSEFEYDLIKDKRFTEDKFQFHVPITMNFKGIGISNINEQINKAIKENEENYIIGIDRGERHLLYLVLINSKGEIVEQYTLNNIKNEYNNIIHETNYHTLLDYKEKEREKARESWQSIENIKNLKEGYLSQVINKITDLMIRYNAIVVLEDLNFGFMRGRQKVEKQVYQKFEKMLIDKLNYLVKKDKDKNEAGGLFKAYQLTNQFESFKKLGKQSGVLYYIPAWNTSKMDPVTGFVNLFYVKYENEEKSKDFVKKMDSIKYNAEKKYFEFEIDYKNYTNKADGTKTKWTLCTYGNRIKTFRNKEKNNQWDSEEINLSEELKKLFKENNIDIESQNLKNDILNIEGKKFWESFINLFRLMLQMRNSITGTEKDYIISPVADENGRFYISGENDRLPKDADANGAYNIARKGLWIIKRIKETSDDKLKNVKLAISNREWLQFIQNKDY